MSTTIPVPYDWLQQVSTSAKEKDEIPLLGYPPPFPWNKFTALLSKTLQAEGLKVESKTLELREANKLFAGLGQPLTKLHFTITPLQGAACWAMAQEDMIRLMTLLLTKQSQPGSIIDAEFQQGFSKFLALEIFHAIAKLEFDKSLSFALLEEAAQLPNEACHCLDVSIAIDQNIFWGRLILSPELRHSWKEYYSSRKMTASVPLALAQKIQVIVHLEAGRTTLALSEWSKVALGDFVALDFCSLDPEDGKGRIMLTINGQPFFRGKLKDGNVKILENPLYHEVDTFMAKSHDEEQDEDSEMEEFEDTEGFEDEELEDTFEEDVSELEKESPPERQKALGSQETAPQKAEPAGVATKDIPLTVVVEVGRLQISVQKLMELQPGNLLELDIHPENGVDLVVNSKRIAKGELLRLGDALGVRILDIG